MIEDEYEYQYYQQCMICLTIATNLVVQMIEQMQEEADIYYGELYDEMEAYEESIICPVCHLGSLREVSHQYCLCSNCGIDIHSSLGDLQRLFANIYQQHQCPRALECHFVHGQGLHFTCPQCSFSHFLQ